MKRKPEWIEKTKKEIDQALNSVELDPNGWEQGFLQNIKKQLDNKGSLTDPQENKLLSILQRSRKWRDDRGWII
jgi:hypothetical protein